MAEDYIRQLFSSWADFLEKEGLVELAEEARAFVRRTQPTPSPFLEGMSQIDLFGETSTKSRRSEQRLRQMVHLELMRRMMPRGHDR